MAEDLVLLQDAGPLLAATVGGGGAVAAVYGAEDLAAGDDEEKGGDDALGGETCARPALDLLHGVDHVVHEGGRVHCAESGQRQQRLRAAPPPQRGRKRWQSKERRKSQRYA